MARPKKLKHEQRCMVSKTNLTPEEDLLVAMNAAAAGLTRAEYQRRSLLGQSIIPPPARADVKLLSELSALGNNANQLSHHMNAGRRFTDAWEDIAGQIYTTIDRIWAVYGLAQGGR
jgi:hypothetical protein